MPPENKTLLLHHHTPTWIGIGLIQIKARREAYLSWYVKRRDPTTLDIEDVERRISTVHEAAAKFLVSAWAVT